MGLISYIFVILFSFHIQPIITSVYKLHLSVLVYYFSSRWFGLCFGFKVQEELKRLLELYKHVEVSITLTVHSLEAALSILSATGFLRVPETVSKELCLHVVEVELELSRWLIKV